MPEGVGPRGAAEADRLLMVFAGIHQTLSAETLLREKGVAVDLVPTPAAITSGCGFSILAPTPAMGGLPLWWYDLGSRRALYRVVMKEGRKHYEEIDRCQGSCVPPTRDHEQEGTR